ncbi:MAG: hypothetical protein AB8B85_22540 [Paracoccaceae bacterium]
MAISFRVRSAGTPAYLGPFEQRDLGFAIAEVNAGICFGSLGTFIHAVRGWRADRQPTPGAYVNIQMQRNGVGSPSTAAGVLVPNVLNSVGSVHTPDPAARLLNKAKFSELTNQIRAALFASAKTHKIVGGRATISLMELTGDFSVNVRA